MDQEKIYKEGDLYGVYSENKVYTEKPKKKRNAKIKSLFRLSIALSLFFLIGSALLSTKTISGKGSGAMSWLANFSIFNQLQNLTGGNEKMLKGEDRGRINILLLGIGGKGHDGGMLTDTIMLLSLDTANKRVAMVSVPRDLSVPIEGYGWRKINSINALAEKEKEGSGGPAISQAFSQIFEEPIDYYLRVDFQGFSKMIDDLGGVKVMVENTLDDYSYPILGQEDNPDYYSRYQHLHVEAGLQEMNGDLALKFARSRHGVGGEGSDFARAKRQQLIIEAVKQKLLESNLFLKPTLIAKMINNYQENVSTNLQTWEMVKLWSMFKDVNKDQIINKVLDNSADGLLTDYKGEDGAYLLIPRSGDFKEVQYSLNNVFGEVPTEIKAQVSEEKSFVVVKNGTYVNGLAGQVAGRLENLDFSITDISNASNKNFSNTVIFDLSNGQKPQSFELLKEKLGASSSTELPDWLKLELENESKYINNYQAPDFIVVVGQNEKEN